jgi:hypothetical protein
LIGSQLLDRFYGKEITAEADGGRSSKDPFFGKGDRTPDPQDVRKAALSNFEARAISSFLGLKNFTDEDLRKNGIAVDRVQGVEYAKGAEELSDREIAQGSVDGKYASYAAAAEKAIIDGRPDMAKELMVLAGKSPAEATKAILEQQKTLSEIAKNNADTNASKFHNVPEGSMVLDERTGKRVAQVPKTFAPQSSGSGGGGSDKESAGVKEARYKSDTAADALSRLRVKTVKGDVRALTASEYNELAKWSLKKTERELKDAPQWVKSLIGQSGGPEGLSKLFAQAKTSQKSYMSQPGAPASGGSAGGATHRWNPKTGKIEQIK